jgi:hypothetical protein
MKSMLNRLKLLVLTGLATAFAAVDRFADNVVQPTLNRLFPAPTMFGPVIREGGFVLLGGRSVQGYAPGTIVELPASTEAALIAAGLATASNGPPTPGNVSTTATSGCVGISAGSSSVTITNPLISPQTVLYAIIAQAAADATLTDVRRVVCGSGTATIYADANATATVSVDWAILNPNGSLSNPQ